MLNIIFFFLEDIAHLNIFLDILRYLAGGEVSQLFALGGSLEYKNIEDHASVMLGFDNGIKSFCEISWLTPMKVRQTFLMEKQFFYRDLLILKK